MLESVNPINTNTDESNKLVESTVQYSSPHSKSVQLDIVYNPVLSVCAADLYIIHLSHTIICTVLYLPIFIYIHIVDLYVY